MEEKELKAYLKAGKIATQAKKNAAKSIKPGMKLLEIAEKIEKEILENEGKPAFPVNLSLNHNAAHYTPSFNDMTELQENDVLKVDIGVHVEGFIADCAFTLNPSNSHSKLLEASEKALQNALSLVKPGLEIGKIGEEIEKTIKSFGFQPVYNLSGHGLQEFEAHAFPTIPNHANKDSKTLEDGTAFAIEPFATDGEGKVREGGVAEIFSIEHPASCRGQAARKILEFAEKEYKTLPFAERWIHNSLKLSEFERKIGLRELMQKGILHSYPVLHEMQGKLVSQAETSIVLNNAEVLILVE